MVCLSAMNTLWCRKASILELQTRLMNYEESRIHREFVDDVDSHVAMTSKKAKSKHKSSSKYNAPPKSSSGQLTCYCCGMKGHTKSECCKREKTECTFCKQKGHIVQGCMKKAPGTEPGSLTWSLKSARASSEATEQDLVVDSGSTDHIVVNKNWFKSIREINIKVTNPDGGKTKVLGIGEVEVLARDIKRCIRLLQLKKALYAPGYRTNLITVSGIIDKGHKVVDEKKNSYLCLKSREKFPIARKWKLFFSPVTANEKHYFANLSGGQMKPNSGTSAWATWTTGTWKILRSWISSSMTKNVKLVVYRKQLKLPFQNKMKIKARKPEKQFLLMLLVQ